MSDLSKITTIQLPGNATGKGAKVPSMWDALRAQCAQLGIQQHLEDELRRGVQLDAINAERRQRKLAETVRGARKRTVDGLGRLTMVMDPFMMALANVQFGAGWSRDRKFKAKFLKANPQFAVQHEKKATVVHPGFPPQRTEVSSQKSEGRLAA